MIVGHLTHRTVRLTLMLLILLPALANAATITGKVVKVIDGDTLDVLQGHQTIRVRLNGIDTPERSQPFGNAAKQFVLGTVAQQIVTVVISDEDRYGRSIGDVYLSDGRKLNNEIVAAGYAWWYRKYSNDLTLRQLEEEARKARRGLWQDNDPMPPWEWRKMNRETH